MVLPTLQDHALADFAANLAFALRPTEVHLTGAPNSDLAEFEWVARVAQAIDAHGPAPIHLIAFQEASQRLDKIAFAQRAARRTVLSYTCVDYVPTGQFSDWPDAPVTIIKSHELALVDLANSARLRGWNFIDASQDSIVTAIATRINQADY